VSFSSMKIAILSLLLCFSFAHCDRVECRNFNSSEIRLVTFDAFGALFDTVNSLYQNFRTIFDFSVSDATVQSFLQTWFGWYASYSNWMFYNQLIENPGVLSPPPDPFQHLMRSTLPGSLAKHKLSVTPDQVDQLMLSLGNLRPHNQGIIDTIKALNNHGIRVGIMSNADDATQMRMAKNLVPAKVDYFFSTTKAQAFKPSPRLYSLPERMGYPKNSILHVAGGGFDAMGARGYGLFSATCTDREYNLLGDPSLEPCFTFHGGAADVVKLFKW